MSVPTPPAVPAAHTVPDVVATPCRRLSLAPTFGGGATELQSLPSQCSSSGFATGTPVDTSVEPKPTAQMSLAEIAAIPVSVLWPCGLGLGTIVQAEPFQCSTRVLLGAPLPLATSIEYPTAQALDGPIAVTLLSRSRTVRPGRCGGTLGLGTIVHVLPFQCSTSVRVTTLVPLSEEDEPTAQMSFGAIAVTPERAFDCDPAGLG